MFHCPFWTLSLCCLGTQIWMNVQTEPTSVASMLSVLTLQAPTDVLALKGSLEMALPVQVGENLEVCPGTIFTEHSLNLLYLKKSRVNGAEIVSLFLHLTYRWICIFLLGETPRPKQLLNNSVYYAQISDPWIQISPLQLTGFVALSKSCHLYGLNFPILKQPQ